MPEIAALTGHSLKDAGTILDKHYLGKDVRLAEAAMAKREARQKLEQKPAGIIAAADAQALAVGKMPGKWGALNRAKSWWAH